MSYWWGHLPLRHLNRILDEKSHVVHDSSRRLDLEVLILAAERYVTEVFAGYVDASVT